MKSLVNLGSYDLIPLSFQLKKKKQNKKQNLCFYALTLKSITSLNQGYSTTILNPLFNAK